MGSQKPVDQSDSSNDHSRPPHTGPESGERLRYALANFGLFFEAARERDPLPSLQEIARDLIGADELHIAIPAGVGPVQFDDAHTLALPITIGGRPVGRLSMRRSTNFTAEDRTLAFIISQIIGVVLEQSSLYGQIEQYHQQAQANADTLEQLLSFKRQIVGGVNDPLQVALLLATHVPEMVGGDRASLLLISADQPDTPQLVLSNGTVTSPERAREVRDNGLAGLVFRECRPLIIDETETDQRWLAMSLKSFEAPSRCAMAAPVLWEDRVIGVITVTTTRSRLFDTSHLNLLELIAHNVALALHSATLNVRVKQLLALQADTVRNLQAPLQAATSTIHHLLPEHPNGIQATVSLDDLRTIAAALAQIDAITQHLRTEPDA